MLNWDKCKKYFNTSNVTIQHCSVLALTVALTYFNTSNVTIQPNRSKGGLIMHIFQYI